ncbi:hypothetical protein XbrCFBP1976_20920 [Xanthomonas bromi]|uniref:Uncharacterized protein n=1 Tax=Xanthomonas bromi TaxID=56449 RepID=A0ABX5BJK7_9XANT|nr:hypothetical protein XbrCFBP1976_20920 [Xanthomonas bromi]
MDSKSTNTKTRTKITTTTHTAPSALNLNVPSRLDVEQQQAVVQMLAGIREELQQTLLDELTGALASARPPNRPVSWFRALVARASRGEYVPDLAVAVAGARKRQEAEAQAARKRQEEAAAAEMRRRDPVTRTKRMAAMQAALAALND